MAIRIIYDQTLSVTANGEATGWIKVQDVTQVVPGCLGFIYDQDTGPVAIRIEAIDSPNSKLQLSVLNDAGSYVIVSLAAYTVAGASKVKIPQQAREDAGYVPPTGGAIAGIVAGGSTAGTGFVTFQNSNGISFGMSNNILTASGGGGGGVAVSAGTNVQSTGTLVFSNSNGLGFGLNTNGVLTGSYTVPTVPPQTQFVFSNSNNVSFGTNGSTVTASASYPAQTEYVFSNSNGISFGTNGNTVTGSYTVPVVPPQTSLVYSNSNNVSFGQNGSTLTAIASFPAQSNQPVAASASNGSFDFSTLRFAEGGGVTWSTNSNGINAVVKTDYQSSNANYLTSQSNQAVSGSNGSFTFQTLSLGASNGVSFYTTNGSIVASYTVPNVPAQSVQPVAASGSNGSFLFSTLSFGNSNGVTFGTSNGSIVASVATNYQSQGAYLTTAALSNHSHGNPSLALTNLSGTTASNSAGFSLSLSAAPPGAGGGIAAAAGTQTQTSGTLQFVNSNGLSFGMSNSSQITGSYTVPVQTSLVFSNSNNVSFGVNGSTLTATATFAQSVQTQNSVAVQGSSGNISFGNANGITFGANASTITASHNALTSQSNQAYSGANGSATFQTLSFANSNGVTFSTGTQGLFASVRTDYQSSNANYLTSQSNQAVSAANGSSTFQTLSFANSNGVTFSTGTQGLFASVQTNYLTTARASNDAIGLNTALTGNGVSVTANSSGLSINVPAFLTTAALSNHSHGNPTLALTNLSGTTASASNGLTLSLSAAAPGGGVALSAGTNSRSTGTVVFANSNGVTFGMDTNGNVTATVQPGAAAGLAAISAGTQQQTSGTLQFVNSNGITFGMSNSSQITASHNGLTQQSTQPVAVSGSNGSFAFSTLTMGASNGLSFYTTNGSVVGSYTVPNVPAQTSLVFSNSNNVSFGVNGSTLTATATFNQTVQPVAVSAANGSVAFSTLTLANSNGVSFSTGTQGVFATVRTDYQSSNANYLTSQSNQAYSAANGSAAFQTLTFANSNGVTFSTGTQGLFASVQTNYLTTARASTDAIGLNTALTGNGVSVTANSSGLSINVPAFLTTAALSNHSHGNPTLALTNLSGTTASASNGLTLSLSAAAPGGGAAIQGSGTYTQNTGTVQFQNSNGVTFGLSNNGVMTASVQAGAAAGIGAVGVGASTMTSGTLVFDNSNGVSFGFNGSTITASHNGLTTAAQSDHSHGNPTLALTNLTGTTASASNGFTLSLSAANPGGGAGVTIKGFDPFPAPLWQTGQVGQSSIFLYQLALPAALSFDRVLFPVSYTNATNSSNQFYVSMRLAFYTNNASTLSLFTSNQVAYQTTNSGTQGAMTGWLGIRNLSMPWSTSIPAGNYWLAIQSFTTTTGGAGMSMSQLLASGYTTAYSGLLGAGPGNTNQLKQYQGVWSAQSAAFPNAISTNAITGSAQAHFRPPIVNFLFGPIG